MDPIQSTSHEEYKGPGKVWSAFGGWGVGGLIGGLATLPFRWKALNSLFKGEAIKSTGLWVGSSVLILASSVVGAVVGWNKAKNGEQQFQDAQTQLNISQNETAHLKQVITVQEENQKRFTDVIASRKHEGGHAAHVAADKENADHHAASI